MTVLNDLTPTFPISAPPTIDCKTETPCAF